MGADGLMVQPGSIGPLRVDYAVNRPETIPVPASRPSRGSSEGMPHVNFQPPARYRGQQMR